VNCSIESTGRGRSCRATLTAKEDNRVGRRRACGHLEKPAKGRTLRLELQRVTAFVQLLLELQQPPLEALVFKHARGGQPHLIGCEALECNLPRHA
jgi:hypothetical protein